jgi:CO/xanthine dehydrogenase FAD-binding subunit
VSAARLVYLNAGDTPITANEAAGLLIGETPTLEVFEAAADSAAQNELQPVGNIHASVPYLRRLAQVLTIRALDTATNRAQLS